MGPPYIPEWADPAIANYLHPYIAFKRTFLVRELLGPLAKSTKRISKDKHTVYYPSLADSLAARQAVIDVWSEMSNSERLYLNLLPSLLLQPQLCRQSTVSSGLLLMIKADIHSADIHSADTVHTYYVDDCTPAGGRHHNITFPYSLTSILSFIICGHKYTSTLSVYPINIQQQNTQTSPLLHSLPSFR